MSAEKDLRIAVMMFEQSNGTEDDYLRLFVAVNNCVKPGLGIGWDAVKQITSKALDDLLDERIPKHERHIRPSDPLLAVQWDRAYERLVYDVSAKIAGEGGSDFNRLLELLRACGWTEDMSDENPDLEDSLRECCEGIRMQPADDINFEEMTSIRGYNAYESVYEETKEFLRIIHGFV